MKVLIATFNTSTKFCPGARFKSLVSLVVYREIKLPRIFTRPQASFLVSEFPIHWDRSFLAQGF